MQGENLKSLRILHALSQCCPLPTFAFEAIVVLLEQKHGIRKIFRRFAMRQRCCRKGRDLLLSDYLLQFSLAQKESS